MRQSSYMIRRLARSITILVSPPENPDRNHTAHGMTLLCTDRGTESRLASSHRAPLVLLLLRAPGLRTVIQRRASNITALRKRSVRPAHAR